MEEIFRLVTPGTSMVLMVSIMFLPIAVWDSQSGLYRSYLHWRAGIVLLLSVLYFGYYSHIDGGDPWAIFSSTCFYVGQAIIISRIMVEHWAHHTHGVRLRRQYHRLTGHEDTPIGAIILPAVIWDAKSGRYHGFFNKPTYVNLTCIAVAAGILSAILEISWLGIMENMVISVSAVIVVSRLWVEWCHYHKYNVWLHRQYHKLMVDEDAIRAMP